MSLAADIGRHSGRAAPSLHDAIYRQFEETTGRRSTYPLPIPVQTNRATSTGPGRGSAKVALGRTCFVRRYDENNKSFSAFY